MKSNQTDTRNNNDNEIKKYLMTGYDDKVSNKIHKVKKDLELRAKLRVLDSKRRILEGDHKFVRDQVKALEHHAHVIAARSWVGCTTRDFSI